MDTGLRPPRTLHQLGTDDPLKGADLVADRRLRIAKLGTRASE